MNIILATKAEIADGQLQLAGRRADHLVKVLRARPGDMVRIGIIDGPRGTGQIVTMVSRHPRSVTLRVECAEPMLAQPRIDLILAMARPIMMRRILSQAAALGVGTFYCIGANRVEKSFWDASLFEGDGYREHLLHGLEQAMDTRLPQVRLHRRFRPFIEDTVPGLLAEYSHWLVADPRGQEQLSDVLVPPTGRVLLAVGPEGGWVDYELQKFREAGFALCTLGQRILKVDTAVVALHARITQLCEG